MGECAYDWSGVSVCACDWSGVSVCVPVIGPV